MRRETRGDSGSIAVNVLVVLVFLGIAAGAMLVFLNAMFPGLARKSAQVRTHQLLDAALKEAAAQLAADPTPESDSPLDPVWDWASSQGSEGTDAHPAVELEDVSSRIDPNWVRKSLFDKTELRTLFSPDSEVVGSPSDYLQQQRQDRGFYSDLWRGYHALFSSRTIARYLTPWSYANLNVTDEFALRKLYEVRTGDAASADVFHTRIQQLLGEQRVVPEAELKSFLGSDYDKLYPAINALPWWNVHFLPELILRQLLAYPDYKVKDPGERADRILSLRENGEIKPADLQALVGLPARHVIYQYLGTSTWFWRVTVTVSSGSLVTILCRLPPGEGAANGARPVFRVVSRRYEQ